MQPFLPFGAEEEKPSSSRLLEELGRVCRELPLEEKILVAPSLAVGHQMVERLALTGCSWINLRVETVRTLAHALIGPSLSREGLRLLSRAQALAFVEQACAEALEADSYFGLLRDRPGLHRAFQRTFEELCEAGISPAALPAAAFGDERKRRELQTILERYAAALKLGAYIDQAGLLRRALEAAEALPSKPTEAIYLLSEATELSAIQMRLLERLAAGRLRILASDPPSAWAAQAKSSHLFRATGEENEVREVFRRIHRDAIPFDDAEILYSDASTYPALLYEIAQEHAIPCTFAGGVAVSFTRPGQAVLALLNWIGRGFEAEVLRDALASGALTLERLAGAREAAPGARAAARALREARIGWGSRRHLAGLDRLIAELETSEPGERQNGGLDAEEQAARAERRARRLAGARIGRAFVARLLVLVPEPAEGLVEPPAVARSAKGFILEFARVSSELDGKAKEALESLLGEFETLPVTRLPFSETVERLADAVRALHVATDRPRPGKIHAADYRAGGFSGRRHTFLVGLDESRHPGRDLEDPVLLDAERKGINRSLAPATLALHRDRPREAALALQSCLARLRGDLTASYSGWNLRSLSQQGEQFPSSFFLDLFRQRSGEPAADYSRLAASLPTAGFIPAEDSVLDDTEWWLSRLKRTGAASAGGATASIVRALYPHLADGHEAEEQRQSDEFTVYDGWIRSRPPELDPRTNGEPLSSSRIEMLARCPFAYFVRHVIKVAPPEDFERDTTRWLDPMMAGSLLHEVFRLFFERITQAGEKPDFEKHGPLMEGIAQEQIQLWREKIPPRSELAFGERRCEILFACRTFLKLEEAHCRELTPRFFEVPFGLAHADARVAIASREPVPIPLAGGDSFLLRGSIDRVDEAPDGSFHVWDYKTGGTYRLKEDLGINGGRQIQHALYAMALETLLERAGVRAAVSHSGYFFPGRKGEGQRFRMTLDAGHTRDVLVRLLDLLRAGAFPHAVREEDCRYCDFELVCGGAQIARERARRKLENATLPALAAFAEIHDPA